MVVAVMVVVEVEAEGADTEEITHKLYNVSDYVLICNMSGLCLNYRYGFVSVA